MAVSEAAPAYRACAVRPSGDPSRKHRNGVACRDVLHLASKSGTSDARQCTTEPCLSRTQPKGHLALSLMFTCCLPGTHVPSRKNWQSIADLLCPLHSVRLGA